MSQDDPLDTDALDDASRKAVDTAHRRRDLEEADMKWLMGNKRGRRVMWRLLETAGVFRTTFTPNSMSMAFAEGRRNMGLEYLAKLMDVSPDAFTLMQKEQQEHVRPADRRDNH